MDCVFSACESQVVSTLRLARRYSKRHCAGAAMIRNEKELAAQQEALEHIERALESLRQKLLPHHPKNFAIYSEGYVEQIQLLKAEIDAYLQQKPSARSEAPPSSPIDQPHARTS